MLFIESPRVCFLHVPKTGGTYTRDAIVNSGLVTSGLAGQHKIPPPENVEVLLAGVRHPLDWMLSWWYFNDYLKKDMHELGELAPLIKGFKPLKFIENLTKQPGIVLHHYESFLYGRKIDYLLRTDRLKSDLVAALTDLGFAFSSDRIFMQPTERSFVRNTAQVPTLPDDLITAFRESQADYYEKYGF